MINLLAKLPDKSESVTCVNEDKDSFVQSIDCLPDRSKPHPDGSRWGQTTPSLAVFIRKNQQSQDHTVIAGEFKERCSQLFPEETKKFQQDFEDNDSHPRFWWFHYENPTASEICAILNILRELEPTEEATWITSRHAVFTAIQMRIPDENIQQEITALLSPPRAELEEKEIASSNLATPITIAEVINFIIEYHKRDYINIAKWFWENFSNLMSPTERKNLLNFVVQNPNNSSIGWTNLELANLELLNQGVDGLGEETSVYNALQHASHADDGDFISRLFASFIGEKFDRSVIKLPTTIEIAKDPASYTAAIFALAAELREKNEKIAKLTAQLSAQPALSPPPRSPRMFGPGTSNDERKTATNSTAPKLN